MARTQINYIVAEVDGDVIPSANVSVYHRNTGEPASITVNSDGSGGNLNPSVTDATGAIPGWIEEGSYTLVITISGYAPYSRAYEAYAGTGVANIAEDAVVTAAIADNVLTTAMIDDDAVITRTIGAAQVTEAKIAADQVITRHFGSKVVGEAELGTDAVTNAKLADDSVGQAQIAANAVTPNEIAAGAVTNVKIAPSSILKAEFANDSITSAKAASNLTSAKLADDAITMEKLGTTTHLVPVGFIAAFPYQVSSPHWGLCDGQTNYARVDYPVLSGVIPTGLFGSDGTNIKLPDLRSRFIWGLGTHADVDAVGDNDGVAAASRSPSHRHGVGTLAISGGSHAHQYYRADVHDWASLESGAQGDGKICTGYGSANTGTSSHDHSISGHVGYGNALTNMPAFLGLYFYMRIK